MSRPTSLGVSLSTLMAASPLLGHQLEDRTPIREAQDQGLAESLRSAMSTGATQVPNAQFVLGAFDILVSEVEGRNRFHVLELNGSGLGGLSNIGESAISAALSEFRTIAASMTDPAPLVLIPATGNDQPGERPRSRLLHEKLLLADVTCEGLRTAYGTCRLETRAKVKESGYASTEPTVVLAYGQELVRDIEVRDGRATLFGRPVTAAFNDRLAMRLVKKGTDPANLLAVNGAFAITADKGVTYGCLNDFLAESRHPLIAPIALSRHADNVDDLSAELAQLRSAGHSVVIKPQATGRGDGIEFFLGGEDSATERSRLLASIAEMDAYYAGGPFPYTITEFVDSRTISQSGHRFDGHKFELRIVIYREGDHLNAYPSIIKICPTRYDSAHRTRQMLINNISAPTSGPDQTRVGRMLPLCNRDTLALIGVSEHEMGALCSFATEFTAYCVAKSAAGLHASAA